MIVIMKIFPPVLEPWTNLTEGVVEDPISIPDLIVNFFTVSDFSGLLSRSAMLPLIVFSILFGFGVNLGPGPDSLIARFLTSLSEAMMKVVQLVTYYAPIAFFGFFANLVATYGSQIATDYARALVVYYPLCFIYIFVAFPLSPGSAAARERSRKCSGTSPNLPSLPWAPAPPWPPSHQHGRGGGHRYLQGCQRDRGSSGRHHAHGWLLLLLHSEDNVPLRRVRPAL